MSEAANPFPLTNIEADMEAVRAHWNCAGASAARRTFSAR